MAELQATGWCPCTHKEHFPELHHRGRACECGLQLGMLIDRCSFSVHTLDCSSRWCLAYLAIFRCSYVATGNDIEGDTPLAAVPNILGLDNNPCPLLFWCYGGEALSSQGLES